MAAAILTGWWKSDSLAAMTRPPLLHSLFASLSGLSGVGEKRAQMLSTRIGTRVIDLLSHLPIGIEQRVETAFAGVRFSTKVIAQVTVLSHEAPPRGSRKPYRIRTETSRGEMLALVYFHVKGDYLKRQLPEGQVRVVSGILDYSSGGFTMVHPDYIVLPSAAATIPRIAPVYPLSKGISQKMLAGLVEKLLPMVPDLPEWQDEAYVKRQRWWPWKASITRLHRPEAEDRGQDLRFLPFRLRLAFDELLAYQLAIAVSRQSTRKEAGRVVDALGQYAARLLQSLPYQLTGDQQKAIAEIAADQRQPLRMMRLLQGDVGSGKTLVALLTCLHAIEAGTQAALLAPTEILARQHAASITEMVNQAGLSGLVEVTLLTGREKGRVRESILQGLAQHRIHLAIGTHALFQEPVSFADLGYIVIDEQHRFGVRQRLALASKGHAPDLLLMTATPIPRTLTLTLYGDMDISTIREKPPGRKPIDTRIISAAREAEVIAGLRRAIQEGNRVYWVCPLVEPTEDTPEEEDTAAAETRFKSLSAVLGQRVGLVHGKMKGERKDATMHDFQRGAIDVLVATTVIEVGVNVPEATIMVIEQAERFGLSQLHQLRGRVGRGEKASTCILLYGEKLSELGRRRLEVIRDTEDGFKIAEEDLALRGSGELLGTKQSGLPDFTFALLPEHTELLLAARDDTKRILETDPHLQSERGAALKHLLYLYEYDAQLRYLRAG